MYNRCTFHWFTRAAFRKLIPGADWPSGRPSAILLEKRLSCIPLYRNSQFCFLNIFFIIRFTQTVMRSVHFIIAKHTFIDGVLVLWCMKTGSKLIFVCKITVKFFLFFLFVHFFYESGYTCEKRLQIAVTAVAILQRKLW